LSFGEDLRHRSNSQKKQAKALRDLIDEARRIHREINQHLKRLRHAGDGPKKR